MKLTTLLRRGIARLVRRQTAGPLSNPDYARDDAEEQIRIMSDREFSEYLRRHSKSHRWSV